MSRKKEDTKIRKCKDEAIVTLIVHDKIGYLMCVQSFSNCPIAAPIALPSPLVAAVASASTSCAVVVVVVEGLERADGQMGS